MFVVLIYWWRLRLCVADVYDVISIFHSFIYTKCIKFFELFNQITIVEYRGVTVPKKRILVTGASKGIGRAIAISLTSEQYSVCVHYHSDKSGANEVSEIINKNGGHAYTLGFDVSDRKTTRTALEEDVDMHGPFYGLVCNAGLSRDVPFPGMSDNDWDEVLQTNLDSFYNVVSPLVMPMIMARKGGRIVTISSASGILGNRGQVNYSAAKAGLIGASKALALELAKKKITVNCVAPGYIDTKMIDKVALESALKIVPMQRIGEPEEVAGLVRFLISDEASYITREVISVNGGVI